MAEGTHGGCPGDIHSQGLEGQRMYQSFSSVIHERETSWDHPKSFLWVIWIRKKVKEGRGTIRWLLAEEGIIREYLKRDPFISNERIKGGKSQGKWENPQTLPCGKVLDLRPATPESANISSSHYPVTKLTTFLPLFLPSPIQHSTYSLELNLPEWEGGKKCNHQSCVKDWLHPGLAY